jgi:hypothetical protein
VLGEVAAPWRSRLDDGADSTANRRVAGALGQLFDVQVSVLGELPHRLRRVREECGSGAQQPLVPGEGALESLTGRLANRSTVTRSR